MAPEDTTGGVGSEFKDHFSGHAAEYASYRPSYPPELFEFLAGAAPASAQAWDCATGNGQSALGLVKYFECVVATDASSRQLAAAQSHERVDYRLEHAESTSLPDASCDLVAVAQAVHWFDRGRFYAEVRRVARPESLIAVWTYDVMRVDRKVDCLLDVLHAETVGAYWPLERELVDSRYASLGFPFREFDVPSFEMEHRWTVEHALRYLSTWSAVRRFVADRGHDPLDQLEAELRTAWGPGSRQVVWPLTVRVGRVA